MPRRPLSPISGFADLRKVPVRGPLSLPLLPPGSAPPNHRPRPGRQVSTIAPTPLDRLSGYGGNLTALWIAPDSPTARVPRNVCDGVSPYVCR